MGSPVSRSSLATFRGIADPARNKPPHAGRSPRLISGKPNLAVVEVRCRFKAPARYDDLVSIRTRLVNVRESLLHFTYEVVRENDGTILAEGETVHLVVDSAFKRKVLPEKYRVPFMRAAGKS